MQKKCRSVNPLLHVVVTSFENQRRMIANVANETVRILKADDKKNKRRTKRGQNNRSGDEATINKRSASSGSVAAPSSSAEGSAEKEKEKHNHQAKEELLDDADEQEATGISASFTSGGITVAGAMNDVENVGYDATNDTDGYEFNIAFAF